MASRSGHDTAQVLGVLAHAKIADHLASGPKTAAELAALTSALAVIAVHFTVV